MVTEKIKEKHKNFIDPTGVTDPVRSLIEDKKRTITLPRDQAADTVEKKPNQTITRQGHRPKVNKARLIQDT